MGTVDTGRASKFRLSKRQERWRLPCPRLRRRPSISGGPRLGFSEADRDLAQKVCRAGFRQRSFVQRRSPLVRRSRALTICIFNRIVMTRQVHLSSSCSVLRACDTVCRSERGSETQSLYIIK
eukprot:scaffold30403_cov65-Phaeocystis_antarctica.AAC.1